MEKLNLVKDRKFGDNISMAFDFIKQNIANTKQVAIYLVALGVIGGLLTAIPVAGAFLSLITTLLASVLAMTYAIVYMKKYVESSDGKVNHDDVMTGVKSFAGSIFGGMLLFGLAVIIGMILLVVPGIYIAVAGVFFGFCIINYGLGIVDSLKKSHELVKNNWWITLGYSLVVGVVLAVISYIFVFIATLFSALGVVGIAIGSALSLTVSYLIYLVTYFAYGVHYYNLVDKKEGVNVSSQIDSLGQN